MIIRAKYVLLGNSVRKDYEIQINTDKIEYIGPVTSKKAEFEFNFPKGFVLPAFVNAHTHIPETLIRGLCDDEDLLTWLFDHVWKVEPFMTGNHAKIGTLLGIAEMISSGTIGFVDQFYFADNIADAVSETGVKAFLAPSIFENDLFTNEVSSYEKSYKACLDTYDKWHGNDNRIFIGFGPHAPYTVEQDIFERIFHEAKARNTLVHTHLNESEQEIKDVQKKLNCTPIEYIDKLKGLSHTIAAHCIHTTAHERDLLLQNKVIVVSNPKSNLKTGSGIAPIAEYLKQGINVCLGTDGSASNNNLNLLEEARLTALLHKGIHKNPKLIPARDIVPLITSNASKIFPSGVYDGILAEGSPADLVVYDLTSPNTTPIINPLSNWLFSAHPSDIVLTMSNGKILFQNGEFKTLDINSVMRQAQVAIEEMMENSDYVPQNFR